MIEQGVREVTTPAEAYSLEIQGSELMDLRQPRLADVLAQLGMEFRSMGRLKLKLRDRAREAVNRNPASKYEGHLPRVLEAQLPPRQRRAPLFVDLHTKSLTCRV